MPACFSRVFKSPQFFSQCIFMCPDFFNHCFSPCLFYTRTHMHSHTLSLHSYYTGIFLNTGIPTILTVPSMLLILYPHTSMSVFFLLCFIGSHYLFLIVLICNRLFCLFGLVWLFSYVMQMWNHSWATSARIEYLKKQDTVWVSVV